MTSTLSEDLRFFFPRPKSARRPSNPALMIQQKQKRSKRMIPAMTPITIPAIGPPPKPVFEPLAAAAVDIVGAAEVEEAVVRLFAGAEVVSWPPSLVVVLSNTDTV